MGLRERKRAILSGILAALAAGAVAAAEPPALPDGPTLYNRVAHASIVFVGRTVDAGKKARVTIMESLRGEPREGTLELSYRNENRLRDPNEPPVRFSVGQVSLFLVEPVVDRSGRVKHPARYRLTGTYKGKIDLPPEGAEALVDACRRFIEIQDLDDQQREWEELRGLLDEQNMRLVHTGLAKIVSFRLVEEELLPELLALLQHPAPALRHEAIQALEQLVVPVGGGEPSPMTSRIISRLKGSARADENEEVRASAVRTLGRLHRTDLADFLRETAARDVSQLVRYEASVALLDLERSGGAR
jgi:hypothetical protein